MPNLLDDGMLITKIHHLAKFHQSIVEILQIFSIIRHLDLFGTYFDHL